MNVELRHLRALAAIGDEGNLTRAAQVLHISQPALSRTLDQLETRLGTRLVERTTRRLALTQAGRRLWEHAHRMLRELDDALAEVTAGQRPLRVGFPWAALGRHTVPLLRSWRAEQPATTLTVRWCDDPEAALRQGEVDAAFLRLPPSPGTGLDVLPLYREPRLAAVPAGDPLAERESLRLADLVPRPVAICATASTTRAELWPEGERPDTFELAGVDEWLTSIATGESVGVTAAGTADSHPHPDVRYLPITDTGPVTVHLAWPHTPTHPATRALREHAVRRLTGRARTQAMSV